MSLANVSVRELLKETQTTVSASLGAADGPAYARDRIEDMGVSCVAAYQRFVYAGRKPEVPIEWRYNPETGCIEVIDPNLRRGFNRHEAF